MVPYMKLSELLTVAKFSELNTLAVADNDDAVLAFINLGVLELYNQFALQTEEYLIELQDGITIYDLPDDFMYLVGAYEAPSQGSSSDSFQLPINEDNNPLSVNTINYRQVQIPLSVTGGYIGIIYVQKPQKMTIDNLDDEVPVPDHMIQALLAFIGFKGHGGIRLNNESEGDIYYLRFKQAIDDLRKRGTTIAADDLSMDTRLALRGFP